MPRSHVFGQPGWLMAWPLTARSENGQDTLLLTTDSVTGRQRTGDRLLYDLGSEAGARG